MLGNLNYFFMSQTLFVVGVFDFKTGFFKSNIGLLFESKSIDFLIKIVDVPL